jgi:hypothetical protein
MAGDHAHTLRKQTITAQHTRVLHAASMQFGLRAGYNGLHTAQLTACQPHTQQAVMLLLQLLLPLLMTRISGSATAVTDVLL